MGQVFTALAGFVGALFIAALTAWLQQRNWQNQEKVKASDRDRENAAAVAAELSGLLSKRIYRQKRFIEATRSKADASHPDVLDYRAVLLEWNDKLGNIQSRLEYSFGRSINAVVEERFQKSLAAINSEINAVRDGRAPARNLASCEHRLNTLNGRANLLVEQLLSRVHRMEIQNYIGIDTVSYANRRNLSCSYLFLRLLGVVSK